MFDREGKTMQNKYKIVLTNDMSDFPALKSNIENLGIDVIVAQPNEESIVMNTIENSPNILGFNGSSLDIETVGRIVEFVEKSEIFPTYFNMYDDNYTTEEIQILLDKGVKFNIHAPCDSMEISHFFQYICISKECCSNNLQQKVLEFTRDTFNRIGVRCIYKGRDYIIAMLYKILFESRNILTIKELYEHCSEKFGVPPENIRKAVDTVVSVCWKGLTKEKKIQRYGKELAEKDKISNYDFILGLAKYIYNNFYFELHKYHKMKES